MTVAGDHLGGYRRHPQPQLVQRRFLDTGFDRGVGADRAGELADADVLAGGHQPLPVTIELVQPAGKDEAEADRLGVNAVGSAGHQRPALLHRPATDDRREPVDIL